MTELHRRVTRDDLLRRRGYAVRRMIVLLEEVHGSLRAVAEVTGLRPATLTRAKLRPYRTQMKSVRALRIAYDHAITLIPPERMAPEARPATSTAAPTNVCCLAAARQRKREAESACALPRPTNPEGTA
jgi:hypothetical protein